MTYVQNKSLKKKHNNKHPNKKTKKKNNKKQTTEYLPTWMINKGITKHIYNHNIHKSYKSILKPLLIWDEIETEIINNYSIPKRYDTSISNKIMDDNLELNKLVNDQLKNYNTMNKEDLIQTLKFLFNNFKEFLFFSIRDERDYLMYIIKILKTHGQKICVL